LRAAALAGLATSALLIAEYRDPLPALCVPGGGCDVVRHSAYAAVLGVPLPLLGALFFSTVLCVAVVPQGRRWLLPVSAAGAVAGASFIMIQAFVLQAFCRLCLIVDSASLLICVAAFIGRRTNLPRLTMSAAAAHVLGAVVVTAGTLSWRASLGARLPVV